MVVIARRELRVLSSCAAKLKAYPDSYPTFIPPYTRSESFCETPHQDL
jgi:hypothetical protein